MRWRGPWLLAAASAALLAVPTAARGDDNVGISFFKPNDPKTEVENIPYSAVVKLLNMYLGSARQLNVYSSLCGGGGLIDQANNVLTMPYFIGAATDAMHTTKLGSSNQDAGDGRLKVGGTFFFGYGPYLTKRLQQAGVPTAQGLHTDTMKGFNADPDTPADTSQTGMSKNADPTLKIAGAAASSHALIFAGNASGFSPNYLGAEAQALKGLKFDSFQFFAHSFAKGTDVGGIPADGPGSLTSFTAALKSLQGQIGGANAQKEVVNIVLDGHGAVIPRNQGAAPGAPREGQLVQGGTPVDIPVSMNALDWSALAIGTPQGDPSLVRASLPNFFLATSEASMSHTFDVKIDGLDVGDLTLPPPDPGTDGSLLEVPLDQSLISQLVAGHDGDSQLTFEFDLQPGDSFRLATLSDLDLDPLYAPMNYGTGLDADLAQLEAVPEPRSLLLLATGAAAGLALVRARRRAGVSPATRR